MAPQPRRSDDVRRVFQQAAQEESSMRRRQSRENSARARKEARAAEEKRRKEEEKRLADESFKQEVLTGLFPAIKSLMQKAFERSGNLEVRSEGDSLTVSVPRKPGDRLVGTPYKEFEMTACPAEEGKIAYSCSGWSVDPQTRGAKRVTTPDDFLELVSRVASRYANASELKLLRAGAQKRAPKP